MTTPGAVTVINTIEPQNDGVFPVVRSVDVQGAVQVFADTTARDAFPAAKLVVGQTVRTLADGGQDWRVAAVSPTVTFEEIVPPSAAEWGSIGGSIASQTDLITLLGGIDSDVTAVEQRVDTLEQDVDDLEARNGVAVLGSDTIVVSMAATSKRRQTRAAAGAITIDGTGYAAGVDVRLEVSNPTASPVAVLVLGAWSPIGTVVTSIPAGDTLIVAVASRGTTAGEVAYGMGLAVAP